MTQGVLSIVKDGKVRMKIIAGCDGGRVIGLATRIRELGRVPTLDEAYQMAQRVRLGSTEDLVVMNETDVKFEGDEDLDPRYRDTFDQPEFNPRWALGTADHVEIVNL